MYTCVLVALLFLGTVTRTDSLVIRDMKPDVRLGRPFPGGGSSGFTIRPRVFSVNNGILFDALDKTSTTTSAPTTWTDDSSEEDTSTTSPGSIDTMVNKISNFIDTRMSKGAQNIRIF